MTKAERNILVETADEPKGAPDLLPSLG